MIEYIVIPWFGNLIKYVYPKLALSITITHVRDSYAWLCYIVIPFGGLVLRYVHPISTLCITFNTFGGFTCMIMVHSDIIWKSCKICIPKTNTTYWPDTIHSWIPNVTIARYITIPCENLVRYVNPKPMCWFCVCLAERLPWFETRISFKDPN